MWNIFLMASHDSIPSSPGTGGRLLPPSTKSGQSGKENYHGTRLTLPATSVNTKSGARVVVDTGCQSCYEQGKSPFFLKKDQFILCGPHRKNKHHGEYILSHRISSRTIAVSQF
jgi:ribosomal protein L32